MRAFRLQGLGTKTWLVLLLCISSRQSLALDEAVQLDGERIQGTLKPKDHGELHFERADGKPELSPRQIEFVNFPAPAAQSLLAATAHRICFRNQQHLTGEFLWLDENVVRFRTPWNDRLKLSRTIVRAITWEAPYASIFEDDFETNLAAWKLTGMPRISGQSRVSGLHSLCFDTPEQIAEYVLAEPLAAGRATVHVLVQPPASGTRWSFMARFEAASGKSGREVDLTGEAGTYKTVLQDSNGEVVTSVARPGWRRLSMEFSPENLTIAVDDDILWSGPRANPGCVLRTVRLSRLIDSSRSTSAEALFFDDFSLARRVESLRRPAGDLTQDEIWLLSGDQVFGSIKSADRRKVHVRARFGERAMNWGDIRGIYFRDESPAPRPRNGSRVRLWLRSAASADQIEGTLVRFDEKRLVLRHDDLGELTIDHRYLQRLHWLSQASPNTAP